MKYPIISILLSITLLSFTLKGKVIRASDGDTIVVLDSTNTQHRIRLDGIDCPEKGQPFGNKATLFVKNLVAGKEVVVEWKKKDRYGRILGYVFIDSTNINKELLRNGLAWHYRFFNKDEELAELEEHAKSKKINIWSEKNPIVPYMWRKNKKRRN